ncbi:MAG: P-type conjugative transfer ATPase TrbB, partial [Acetobacteraceae bacterium]
ADHAGVVVTDERPLVSASLPLTGERFQGVFPPITATPSFAIRKPARAVFRLDDYVRRGQLTAGEAATLRQAIADRLNVLIIGGTSSGKTTFANALLAEPAFSQDRVVIIEQTQELQCVAPDCLPMLTREIEPRVTTRDLVVASLRLRPDRIVIGEVRDGAALEMIKAWNTGHPGGLGTLHANSPIDALYRIEDLIGEVSERIPYRAIASSINVIVEIKRTPEGRRVTAIMRVAGWQDGRYLFADDQRIGE